MHLSDAVDISSFILSGGFDCSCGRRHDASSVHHILLENRAVRKIPAILRSEGVRSIFIITDDNTELIAGSTVMKALEEKNFDVRHICLHGSPKILPDEEYLSILEATCPSDTDFILGVGSGVINDLSKMLSHKRGIPCGIVATAPSMDGYASSSSAMEIGGIKKTVYTTVPSVIVCDTSILRDAPQEMISSGFGDMAAKVISIADWKIAHIITGEYYCEELADIMTKVTMETMSLAFELRRRSEKAVTKLTEGLLLSGLVSTMAGVSRPASGMEHTFSHLLEMFALSSGRKPASHGLQVGVGVREALKLYEKAYSFTPTKEKFREIASSFSEEKWASDLRRVFHSQAETLILDAMREGRNTEKAILQRGLSAVEHWNEIREVIASVLEKKDLILSSLDMMRIPTLETISSLGYTYEEGRNALLYSRDLRSRYIFTSMCFDIGLDITP